MLRLTGRVVKTDTRSGQSADKVTGELKPWSFDIYTVLVADQAVVNVQKFGSNPSPSPSVGDHIDVGVEVDVFRGTPSFQFVKPWAELTAAVAPPVQRPTPVGSPSGPAAQRVAQPA